MPAVLTVPVAKHDLRSCVKCGRVGHAQAECAHPAKAINMIGCEIEGYWTDTTAVTAKCRLLGASWAGDGSLGSVAVCALGRAWYQFENFGTGPRPTQAHSNRDCPVCVCHALEIRTQPGSLAAMINQISQLYPDAVSGKASLHVHVSFLDRMSISLIACKAFHDHFRASITQFCDTRKLVADHWLRRRVRGESSDPDDTRRGQSGGFCAREQYTGEFPAIMIVNQIDGATGNHFQGSRYQMINYLAFANHGTIEFRVGSAFADPVDAIAYVVHLHDMIEAWIAENGVEVVATTLGDVALHPDAGRGMIEIAAPPDAPALVRDEIVIAAGDLEIPTVKPGSRLATVQTALAMAHEEARQATEDHIITDRNTGLPRLRSRPRRVSER